MFVEWFSEHSGGQPPPMSVKTLGKQKRSLPQSRGTKDNLQRPRTKKPMLEVGEEVNTGPGTTQGGHGQHRRKSWRLLGSSRRCQQQEAPQQSSKNKRGRIGNKPVVDSESERIIICYHSSSLLLAQADGTRRIFT